MWSTENLQGLTGGDKEVYLICITDQGCQICDYHLSYVLWWGKLRTTTILHQNFKLPHRYMNNNVHIYLFMQIRRKIFYILFYVIPNSELVYFFSNTEDENFKSSIFYFFSTEDKLQSTSIITFHNLLAKQFKYLI